MSAKSSQKRVGLMEMIHHQMARFLELYYPQIYPLFEADAYEKSIGSSWLLCSEGEIQQQLVPSSHHLILMTQLKVARAEVERALEMGLRIAHPSRVQGLLQQLIWGVEMVGWRWVVQPWHPPAPQSWRASLDWQRKGCQQMLRDLRGCA